MTTQDKIKKLCAMHKTTVTELEKKLGFSNSSLKKVGPIRSDRLLLIAKEFNVSMESLMDDQDLEPEEIKPDVPKMSFSSNLQKLMRRHNMSQEELATKIGVTRSCIGNYVQGTRLPDIEVIAKLANVFHISINSLLYGSDGNKAIDEELNRMNNKELLTIINKASSIMYSREKSK